MLVKDLHASVLRFCADFATEHGLGFVNFDAAADESQLPDQNCIGMSGLAWEVDEELLDVNVMIGICTKDDSNLFKMIELIAPLYERLLPTKKIRVYDADSGEAKGWFVVQNGTRALPVGGSTVRPIQHIMVGLSSTVYFDLRS